MKRKYLLIPLICVATSLAAFSGVFAVCVERSYNLGDRYEMGERIRDQWEYEDCLKREKAEREARKAAEEQELRKKEGKDAVGKPEEPKKDSEYPFMEDVRDINKKERTY